MLRRTDRGYRGKSVSLYGVDSDGGTPTTVRTDLLDRIRDDLLSSGRYAGHDAHQPRPATTLRLPCNK